MALKSPFRTVPSSWFT